ncbi:MAG: acetyl-CoA C-acyltransferase [Bacteroidia bacterium]|jgi:acetyl-CoA C-acetyltransferase|nr:acetyl-CoA C-acyltransferase [Bacteroidia bacterium]|tara:strand:- start:2076 stop:3254 length:1179 start_codon:yes stop_codon:yes gene_type:complete
MKRVFIVSAVRTPMGSFNGKLSGISAPNLGAIAIKGALAKAGVKPTDIDEVYFGNVLQAGLGQAPARQAAIFAGLPNTTPCTTINKVCASGMKSVALGASSIMLGNNDMVVTGGMENMSQVPHYLPGSRGGYKYGNFTAVDGLAHDGLRDVYNEYMMGSAADNTAKVHGITREEQDEFAINSYKTSAASWEAGKFKNEIVPVEIPQRRGDAIIMDEDEEYKNVRFDKIPSLRPVFEKDGTVTAANASTINDGAACIILASEDKVKELGLTPIAEVVSFADAAHEPEFFTTAPAKAIPIALERAGCTIADVDAFELNEAFSVVALVNNKLLGLDASKVNINGGAVALGHPLGASGARILVTLIHVLKQNGGKIGAAAICNGGGGASAMVIKNI